MDSSADLPGHALEVFAFTLSLPEGFLSKCARDRQLSIAKAEREKPGP